MLSFTDGRELRTQEKVRKSNHGEASKTDQNLLVQRRKNIKTDHISFRTPSNLSFSNKGKGSTTIHIKTKENNVENNQNEVAETLDSDFKNAALNIGDHVCRLTEDDHSEHDSVRSIREVYEENNLDFKLLAPNEVQRALENINPKKSSGWDSTISPKLLKSVANGTAIFSSLRNDYNHCIEKREWPASWEMGEWTPLFKKGDRQDVKTIAPLLHL